MTHDVFGTAALRRSVLEAWSSSPTRLREDANTEEDHAHGSYRDRVVVEIAQNAADAAVRAGRPGRLWLSLHAPSDVSGTWVLRAANTGDPLDATGVASLAAMRASAASRDRDRDPAREPGRGPGGTAGPDVGPGAVGRFGVGFAALRSVADVVRIGAGERAVEMSLTRTRTALDALVRDVPGLAEIVASRGDRLPVLRLPFPTSLELPPGPDGPGAAEEWDTLVELELRDDAAVAAVRAQLDAVDDVLLLALPALAEVTVETGDDRRVLADVDRRWRTVRAEGDVAPDVLAGLPVEDRGRARWSVTWARRRDGRDLPVPPVLHAPTPTDERSTFPALLLASFPLDPSRRHVRPGPLADGVAAEAGRAYARLVAAEASALGPRVLGLVPTGMPAGALDAAIRAAALDALAHTPVLAVVPAGEADGAALVTPAQACVLPGPVGADPAARTALGVAHLVDVPAGLLPVARTLGVEVLDLADVVEGLAIPADPARLRDLYAALAPHLLDAQVREAAAALPVLLADGRAVRGVRGLLVLDESTAPGAARRLTDLGLRVVDPRASHPALGRLGARTVGLHGVVAEPALRERVLAAARAAEDGDDPATDALLGLVQDVVADGHGDVPLPFWWGELPVSTTGGELVAVRGCVLEGTWAHDVLTGLDVVAPDVVDRWGLETLRALGAVTGLAVHVVRDVVTPVAGETVGLAEHEPAGWLSDWDGYLEHLATVLGPGVYVGDVPAVADLDAVDDDAWSVVLSRLATEPALRRALLDPVRGEGATGSSRDRHGAPSYTAWWLRGELDAPFTTGDLPWFGPPPRAVVEAAEDIDDRVLAAIGGVDGLTDLEPQGWPEVLERVDDVGSAVRAEDAVVLWRALADLAAAGEELDPAPVRLPALAPDGVRAVAAEDLVVAPDPMWAPLRCVVPAPPGLVEAVADLLDLPVVAGTAPEPDDAGVPTPVPAVAARVLRSVPEVWFEHREVRVRGTVVPWWVVGRGAGARVHATDTDSLADALAAAAGDFASRRVVAALLSRPGLVDLEVAMTAWDAQPSVPEPPGR
ncbi:ATP-binding protein [Cellulosimicrobium terreum]|nr:ATP-binding protein [Cellulosimicrobium terreum]